MWSNISTSSSPISTSDQIQHDDNHHGQHEENIKQEEGGINCKRRFGSPPVRYKHAVCASQSSGYIYIHGGRFGNLPLDDDVWRFDPHQNSWIQLQTSGCRPPSLQEHTLLEFDHRLYLFGGQISAPSSGHSFWCLDLANNQWRSLSTKTSTRYGAYLGPTNRRGHTAVLHGNSMYVYGGFEDFRGSSGQLWEFDLLNERWELRNLSATSSCHPEPRHSHSAIVHNDSMYIYGGLSNLKPLGDLWRWSWRERRWFRERTKGSSPGQLHGHTAVQAFDSMFVFGGERNGRATRGLWRLNLANMTWRKIRPKGPRPSPTTWHAAIANPLSILDEANYIIEGDPELMDLKDVHCCTQDNSLQQQQQPASVLKHSKSSNAADGLATAIRNGLDRSKQRKSRLGFLRKSRNHPSDRPKSIYELKQLRASLSAQNFNKHDNHHPSDQNNSCHQSLALTKQEPTTTCDLDQDQDNEMECESEEEPRSGKNNNVGILDSLDTDIKAMFQRAMSPDNNNNNNNSNNKQLERDNGDETTPMSVDVSSRSYYVTAPVERASGTIGSSMNHLRSQRTSYAYTTPPSEMNTLTDDFVNSDELAAPKLENGVRSSLASAEPSGYDRRNNRPRSEIVQSLIDRADARIKHLYTPYFNTNQPHSSSDRLIVRRREPRRGQSFLDKTKRHTIHQTMTYYNLYYSEESKSSSGDSASNQDSSSSPKDEDKTEPIGKLRDIDDFGSSSTMKEVGVVDGRTSAVLVGVHQNQQADQLSLLDTGSHRSSSETQTLCQDPSQLQASSSPDDHQQQASSGGGSLQNALTARRDTTTGAESGDNTSLSFSVIAEFEEDDMLQFSSPVTGKNNASPSRCSIESFQHESQMTATMITSSATTTTNRVETILMREPEDQLQTVILTDQHSGSSQVQRVNNSAEQPAGLRANNKSSSSGYDSIASRDPETPSREATTVDSNNQPTSSYSGSRSIRTTESVSSSMAGGLASSTTIDTTTSPEQSAMKKLRARYETSQQQLKPSVLSSDSLAAIETLSPTASQSESSSPEKSYSQTQSTRTEASKQTQRKMPLMSRSRFFGRSSSKSRYWQLCMFVIGGKQNQTVNEPITVWRLYI